MAILIFLFILSIFHTCLSLTCSELQENQCKTLQTNGCKWSGEICSGSFSPSCIPPSCYYIDSSSTDTATPTGTHAKPFTTLTQGCSKLSGKDGTLIIINRFEGMEVTMTAAATISSSITIQPLFDDARYKIDVSPFSSTARLVFNVKKYLKVIGASLTANFTIEAVFFSLTSAQVYLEDVEILNIPYFGSATTLMTRASGSTSIFSMTDCKIADSYVVFQINAGKVFWKNVYASGKNYITTLLTLKTSMTMEDCFFTGTLTTQSLIRATLATVEMRNCTFRELTATNIITGLSPTLVNINNCIFDQIIYTNQQGLLYFAPASQQPFEVMVNNCSFTNIKVMTSIFAVQGPDGVLSLMNVNMTNVTQNTESPTKMIMTRNKFTWSQGLCVASVWNAEIYIESSNFSNIGSHCFWLEDTDLNMNNSIFDNEKIDVDEKSILREDISSLTEYSGVSWIRLKTTTNYEKQVSQAVITNNKFIQNKLRSEYGGAIRITGVFASEVQVSGNEFIGNNAYYGGAISSDNAFAGLELSENIFSDNYAFHGGAIYKISTESDEKLSRVSLAIDKDQFLGNTAVKNGGAIYLNWESIYFSNTEFFSNKATNGGAIYFINLDEAYHNKYGRRFSNVKFIENSASNIGGSMKIFFEYSKLKTNDRVLIFQDNLDRENNKEGISQGRPAYYFLSFYDITSQNHPKITDNLQDWIDNSDLTKLAFTMNTSETTSQFPEIQQKSGNQLSQIMKVQVFDNENKLADYINDEEVKFEIASYENNISKFSASLVYNSIKFQFDKGQFLAKGTIKMHGEPNTTAILRLQNIAGYSDFIQDSGMRGTFDLQVRFMDCEIGEIFEKQTRSCSACAAGSYTVDDPYKATYCNECPANLDCLGGTKIGPKAGYWMYNLTALTAMKCPYSPACLGSFSSGKQYSVQGECEYPHQGNLCNQCAPKYAKFGNSARCRDCENDVMYYVRLIFFLLIQAAVALCIRKFNCGKEEKQSKRSIFYLNLIKILVSFIQMSSVIISHDLNWSTLSKDAVDTLNKIFPSDKDGFPIDCFIALVLPDNHHINFVRLIATLFQPFVLWGICILIYFLALLHSARRSPSFGSQMKASLGSLFVICVFIVQPNMILTALELFKCQNISGPESRELFLANNSDIRCWTHSHIVWGYGFGLPIFLIWGVILPFILFIKTTKYWTTAGSTWRPFYYQGLRKETFYWEFIVMIVKTLIISVFTVFTSTSRVIQILITLLICLSLTVVFLKLHPYQDPRLHLSSLISFIALSFMCYVGFFFLSQTWSDTQVTVTSVLLVILNCTVFVYPVFSILKDRIKPKKMGTHTTIESPKELKETNKITLSGKTEEKSNADESVHNVSNHEIKIQEIVHSERASSIDNFTIMQRSGSALFSPYRASSMLIKYPSTLSPPASREDMIIPKGDFSSSNSIRHKKLYMKRVNMKSALAFEDENMKSENTERIITEHVKTEMTISTPRLRTQGETELENLLNTLKTGSTVSKSNEQ